jgi:NAD(P)-dependent dehydrogenase (short-subunit alcohol dehydrogenase family)
MHQRLSGKLALITGASRGIGAAIAKRYAQEGAQLILVARSTKGLEATDDAIRQWGGADPLLVPCDLIDYPKIDEMAKAIHDQYGKLDILVGNAGMLGSLMPLQQFPVKIWHETIGLNLNTNWHLIRAFDPLLRLSEQGRAIFVTTGAAHNPPAYWGAYATSKAALEAMVKIYAEEIKNNTNLKVNMVNPGATNTDMLDKAFPGKDLSEYPSPDEITEAFVQLAEDSCPYQGEIIEAQLSEFMAMRG